MRHVLIALLVSLCAAGLAWADEQQLASDYSSYEAAYANGELRTARDLADSVYLQAIEVFGEGSIEADRYGAAYAKTLNDLFEFQAAIEILQARLNAGEERQGNYELFLEISRTLWGLHEYDQSQEFARYALGVAEVVYGVDSLQAAFAHLELARAFPNRSTRVVGDPLHARVIGRGYPYFAGSAEAVDRASAIFGQHPNTTRYIETLNVIRGANALAEGDRNTADDYIEPAARTLADLGYMDDYILTVYVDWVASHLTHWSNVRMERYLLRAAEYGELRREGRPIPLARAAALPYRRACIDFPNGEGGYALMEYSVNAEGQVPRTRAIETNLPDRWIEEQRRMMRTWAYVPAQNDGEPVRVDGLQFYGIASAGRSCR